VSFFAALWRRRVAPIHAAGLDTLLRPGFVALDLETTGLDPARDTILELAAIPFVEGRAGAGYVTRVDPGRPIPPESSRVHGITDAMVRGAPSLARVLVELEEFLGDRVVVGHGLAFDLAVLARARRAQGRSRIVNPALDTMRLAAALHPDWEHFGFDEVAARLGIGILGRHTAEADALAAGELLLALSQEARARGVRTVGELLWLQETAARG
jgi:DNA polymerase III epsilon subunit family exonuclease